MFTASYSFTNRTGDIQSDANVEENANQRTFRDVTANVRRWRWNGRSPGTAGTESFFQMASSSIEIGDVSEMAAFHINCATWGTIELCLDASQRVEIVFAEIAIGAERDGRQIGVFNRMWFVNWWADMAIVTRWLSWWRGWWSWWRTRNGTVGITSGASRGQTHFVIFQWKFFCDEILCDIWTLKIKSKNKNLLKQIVRVCKWCLVRPLLKAVKRWGPRQWLTDIETPELKRRRK